MNHISKITKGRRGELSKIIQTQSIHPLFHSINICLLIATLFSCNRDKAYIEKGLEKELEGKTSEALHLYSQAYKVNPYNPITNEKLGFLLSESQFSIIPAIYHLEITLGKEPENLKVALKLIDLTLFIADYSKSKRIQKEIAYLLDDNEITLLSLVTGCLESTNPKDKKGYLDKIEEKMPTSNIKYFYRSLSLCYESNGASVKAEEIATSYRKKLLENP